jgi:hypothetical protein
MAISGSRVSIIHVKLVQTCNLRVISKKTLMNITSTPISLYELYVVKLCQKAAIDPEELVEILLELACSNLPYRRARLLSSAGLVARAEVEHRLVDAPISTLQRALLNRAFVAGACIIDDLEPGALARQVRRMIAAGHTQDWPILVASAVQLKHLVEQIERHTQYFAAHRTQRRERRQRVYERQQA